MTRKKFIVILIALGALIASGYGLYRLGMNRGQHTVASSTTPAAVQDAAPPKSERKILYWRDPMVPGSRFDKPGRSPFMNMPLAPVYADGEGDVTISPRMQQNLGIRTAEVKRGRMTPTVDAVGNVTYNERDVAVVQARSNGFVEKLYVRAPFDAVRQGQALAELYVPDWVAAQEEYFTVKRLSGPGLDALLDGARQRMRLAGMTDEQIRQVESSGGVRARLTVSAPIAGVVTELSVREGMTVTPGTPLFRINGLHSVWVNAEVPETFAARVREGDRVEARVAASGARVFKGRVQAVLPAIDPATRTITARVELANPDHRLVPGMFATLRIASTAHEVALTVPTEAVIRTGRRDVVIVAEDTGRFAPVDVEVGLEFHGETEIRRGLEVGQRVVVSGQFLIDSEASLAASTLRMSAGPGVPVESTAVVHHGTGKIESIGDNAIVISHGPIPTLHWGPMTMGFKPPAGGAPKQLSVGETVTFAIRATGDGLFELVSIEPTPTAGDVTTHEEPAQDGHARRREPK